jgi:hypothetical protein
MSPSHAAPPPETPLAIYVSLAMMVSTLVAPVAIGYFFAFHPMEGDRGFGVLLIAASAMLLSGISAVALAVVGGRGHPRSVVTRVTLRLAVVWAIGLIALIAWIFKIFI